MDNVNIASVSLNPDNVKVACHDCHNRKHRRFVKGSERGIYIVYGSPLAGKKTYVRDNIIRGDMVVDMDSLYSAISFSNLYDNVGVLKYNVFAIKNVLIDNIKTRYGKFGNAWIIGGYQNKRDRERLAQDLNAKLIFVDTKKDECIKRLSTCSDYRRYQQTQWKKYIEKWFDEFIC